MPTDSTPINPTLDRICTRCLRPRDPSCFRQRSDRPGSFISWCRECECEHQRQYSKEHKEERKAKRRVYDAAHGEQRRDALKKWRAKNPEKVRAATRRSKHHQPEANRARVKQWAKDNPDKAREQHRLRKARKQGNGGSFSESDWERLKAQYDWRCLACGVQEPQVVLQADHVIPLAMGGFNIISNIQPLCPFHNNSKWKRFIDYRPDPYRID